MTNYIRKLHTISMYKVVKGGEGGPKIVCRKLALTLSMFSIYEMHVQNLDGVEGRGVEVQKSCSRNLLTLLISINFK